jgi:D-tyrosyl-tRNA(Tyr) deacylase
MRAVCQRVSQARVTVDDEVVGEIGPGWLVLLGVGPGDDESTAARLADKVVGLRVFEDEAGKMNRSVVDAGGAVLVVSQFTLYADTSRGRRPGFTGAAPPAVAEPLVTHFAELVRARGLRVETGRFGAHMAVSLTNDGPVTIVLEEETGDRRQETGGGSSAGRGATG